jgi:hypothetical protein
MRIGARRWRRPVAIMIAVAVAVTVALASVAGWSGPGEGEFQFAVVNDTAMPVILVNSCSVSLCNAREEHSPAQRRVVATLSPGGSAHVTGPSGGDELPEVLVLNTTFEKIGCVATSYAAPVSGLAVPVSQSRATPGCR